MLMFLLSTYRCLFFLAHARLISEFVCTMFIESCVSRLKRDVSKVDHKDMCMRFPPGSEVVFLGVSHSA